jgi:ABC-type Fe3+ transport system permease subunit
MTRDSGRETRCARNRQDYLGRKNGGRGASMIVGRLIGWIVFLAGAIVLVRDGLVWVGSKHWAPIALGQLWYELNRSSLNLAQAVTQRYIHPFLWDPIIVTILLSWAFAVLMILGVLLVALFRRREHAPFSGGPC